MSAPGQGRVFNLTEDECEDDPVLINSLLCYCFGFQFTDTQMSELNMEACQPIVRLAATAYAKIFRIRTGQTDTPATSTPMLSTPGGILLEPITEQATESATSSSTTRLPTSGPTERPTESTTSSSTTWLPQSDPNNVPTAMSPRREK